MITSNDTKLVRAAVPEQQCKGPGRAGESQCDYMSCTALRANDLYDHGYDSDMCPRHAGRPPNLVNRLKRYHFAGMLKEDVERHSSVEAVTDLTVEMAALRSLLEHTINRCTSDHMLQISTPRIADLVSKIESVAKTITTIETRLGNVLTMDEAVALIDKMAAIVVENIQDPVTITEIQKCLDLVLEDK